MRFDALKDRREQRIGDVWQQDTDRVRPPGPER
jgi:hypothetical protein